MTEKTKPDVLCRHLRAAAVRADFMAINHEELPDGSGFWMDLARDLAEVVHAMKLLARQDAIISRAFGPTFGALRDPLLDTIPDAIRGTMSAQRLGTMATQLRIVAVQVEELTVPKPKELDIAGAIEAERLEREAERKKTSDSLFEEIAAGPRAVKPRGFA